jgi:acyl-coenzyme A synthetase/AMP-(fatty) acid ligase
MGFVVNLIVNLVAGARSSILASHESKLSAELMLRACRELRPTVCNTVPWVVEGFVKMLRAGDPGVADELSRLSLLTWGGAALPEEHAQLLCEHGVMLQCTYGQTELAGPILFGTKGSHHPVYRPLRGIEYELVRGVADGPNEGKLVLLGARSATHGYLAMSTSHEDVRITSVSDGTRSSHERFDTNDRFEHVYIPGQEGVWLRFLSRDDDLLVHTSGEMTNPVITEQAILASGVISGGGVSRRTYRTYIGTYGECRANTWESYIRRSL